MRGSRAFNLFDLSQPDSLPRDLKIAQSAFGGIFELLQRQFGFQEESIRNQQEHLLLLLANCSSRDVNGHNALHRKLLGNYRHWAKQLLTQAQCAGDSDIAQNKMIDISLYLLVWGEAANLRHVPECICFLFHQMRLELWAGAAVSSNTNRPPGWFLSKVIAPLYRLMRLEMKKTAESGKPMGHTRGCNYDDFNEFFWTPACLKFGYHENQEGELTQARSSQQLAQQLQGKSTASIVDSISKTFGQDIWPAEPDLPPEISSLPPIKRYVERRSWLHPLRSFWRIYAFHLYVLHVMVCLAACTTRTGVVINGTLLQALCGVFITHSTLGVLRELVALFNDWGLLHTHPKLLVSWVLRSAVKAGFATAIATSYMVMVKNAPSKGMDMPVSKWVQSVLLADENSGFCHAAGLYAVPMLLQWAGQLMPALSTWVRSWSGFPKKIIDVLDPINQIIVGKDIHTTFEEKLNFDFFWLSLLSLKFWFSYTYQIGPLVPAVVAIWNLDLSWWYPSMGLAQFPNLIVCFVRCAPMLVMYMIDMQIWFMLWTAGYGTVLGWTMRIGEVPTFTTVRERFLSASKHFNRKILSDAVPLISEVEPAYAVPSFSAASSAGRGVEMRGKSNKDGKDKLGMAELQQGLLGVSSTLGNESLRFFAEAWNGVLDDMRQSDMVNNHELQVLVFNKWEGDSFSRCTYLPVFITAGKLNEAIHQATVIASEGESTSLNKQLGLEAKLHAALGKDFAMREACVEFWELSKWVLTALLGDRHEGSLARVVSCVLAHLQEGSVLDVLVATKLPALVKAVVDMTKALLSIKVDASEPREPKLDAGTNLSAIADHCRAVLDALERAFSSDKRMMEELEALKFTSSGLFWDETYRASQVLRLAQQDGTAAQLRGLLALCNTAVVDVKPKHWEVQRRLAWFISSLFMDVPRPAPVARMQSWSVLTPFYAEDLLYSAKELALKNEDGISVLYFLKTVHGDEWTSFLERVGVAAKDEAQLWQDRKLALELRLWASFRGQTLVRTVEGMMLHERALRLQASWEGMHGESLEQIIRQKFSYVVSCQAYGQHKKARDPKAADTEYLVQRFRNLRVAYVDKAVTFSQGRNADGSPGAMRESVRFYSVLAKGVREGAEEVMQEVFRVQLPGDIMLGEGKPENQNHAIIFTRGEHLQAIDMNQCGYFEEALKMRNLLHEFVLQPGASIIGFREHIFTGGLSSLASYMALQEGCFVTLTQRVLWEPLKVRLHYGHPDVFDKLYSMTRGGVSKASRGINLSEDIYAGFNHMLRGGTIPYIEYMQVGKGRDVGMQQIYKFEAKLASGNGEQCLSRDVFRIGQRLDFTRLLSFYYSGIGFYLNNAATVFAMFAFMYLVLWSHTLQLDAGVPIVDLLNAQWSLQLGLLLTVPILCYLSVEHGLLHALVQLLRVWVTGAPFFFMFHMGTKAHYFDSTLKFGGAKYRPTGRGFVMIHEQFAELYRFYAASHLYNGFELLWGLLLLAKLGTWPLGAAQYWRTCWSIWAVMAAWLFSPLWFNPSAFDITKVRADLADWQLWMARKDASALSSWEAWWYEEHSSVHTHSWSKKVYTVLPAVRYFLTAGGILAALAKQPISAGLLKELRLFGSLLGIIGGGVGLLSLLRGLLRQSHLLLRVCSTCLLVVVCTAVPLILQRTSLTNVLLLAAAASYLFASLVRVPLALGYTPRATRLCFLVYDYFLGGLLLLLCFALTAPGFVKHVQNRALLSNTFAKGVKYAELSRLLPG